MSTKRAHNKSRLGCKQCKNRRIKCDETPPRCNNCTKKGLECDYQGWEEAFKNIRFFAPPTLPQATSQSTSIEPAEPSEPPTGHTTAPTFTLDDMGLLCHFILHTSQTMDFSGEATVQIWQREVPQIAKPHAFLMHALLAFAALHQAKTGGDQVPQSLRLARHHYGQALTLFRQSVSQVSGEQPDVLLTFGILINFLTVNLDLEKAVDQKDPIDSFATFFTILHNSVGMLVPIRNSLRATAVATQLRQALNAQVPHDISPDASQSLDRLTGLALLHYPDLNTGTGETLLISNTLVKLRQFYAVVPPHPSNWNRILHWPIELDPEFSKLLQNRSPIALCILAHWCVPFHNAPTRWYFGERPRLLMLAIARQLHGSEWVKGITWPLTETVGEIRY